MRASDEDPPPPTLLLLLSLPSTSTCSPDATSSSISFLSIDFDKLSLEPELQEGRYELRPSPGPQTLQRITQNSMPPTARIAQFYRIPAHKSGRFQPYNVPFQLRRRRKSTTSASTKQTDMEILLKIKLKGDVDPLKMCIFDKDKLVSTPCSVQANRRPEPARNEEIDELSEYFTHFVRVELKMSALAESMYV
ncbi:unnamed protein product [Caenorhabditis sp. 36 PRJEB53466]|nr:unnamed protein product [Caenorhabditis sp. 36 PRJEB53466]